MGQTDASFLNERRGGEPGHAARRWVEIDLERQKLVVLEGATPRAEFPVSTALAGAGEREGSLCTPRGWHCVRAKIGAGTALGTVFVGRRPTGEIYSPQLGERYRDRDWILTRILWLSGLEKGRNRFGAVDTMRRYIYIHGCPDEVPLGVPGSKGCVRMHGAALIELFDALPAGARVLIHE